MVPSKNIAASDSAQTCTKAKRTTQKKSKNTKGEKDKKTCVREQRKVHKMEKKNL